MNFSHIEIAFSFIALVFSFMACQKKEDKSQLIFSGKIENVLADSVHIKDINYIPKYSIVIDENHSFRDTFELEEGFYYLSIGKENTRLYLKPGFDLSLTVDSKIFDESLKYAGKGMEENNYLAKKMLLKVGFRKSNSIRYRSKLKESDFLNLIDSLFEIETKYLEETKNLSDNFKFLESKSILFSKINSIGSFPAMKRYFTDEKNFKVSENYPNFDRIAQNHLDDERLLKVQNYLPLIDSYLKKITPDQKDSSNTEFVFKYIKAITNEFENPSIKEELIFRAGKNYINQSKFPDELYQKINPLLIKEEYKNNLATRYGYIQKSRKGMPSPDFEFEDVNGELVSLKSLRGKLIYIDIWATWCAPCIKEIPHLKQLDKDFENDDIQFVSICIEDTKERWKKAIEIKSLGGIQLFAPDETISFFKTFSIQGIPRFILLDQNGHVLDRNVKRPSNPELKKDLEEHLSSI